MPPAGGDGAEMAGYMKQVHGARLAKWDRSRNTMEARNTGRFHGREDIAGVILVQRRRSYTTVDVLDIVRGEVAEAIIEERSDRI